MDCSGFVHWFWWILTFFLQITKSGFEDRSWWISKNTIVWLCMSGNGVHPNIYIYGEQWKVNDKQWDFGCLSFSDSPISWCYWLLIFNRYQVEAIAWSTSSGVTDGAVAQKLEFWWIQSQCLWWNMCIVCVCPELFTFYTFKTVVIYLHSLWR